MWRNSKKWIIVDVVTYVSQTNAIHTMAWWLGGSMFQEVEQAESSTLATPGSYPLPTSSLRATITATIIREEAAESLLPDIQGDAERAALTHVLNRYKAQWWLLHLHRVGADPVSYWRKQLGAEIMGATRDKNGPSQRKKLLWRFFQSFTPTGKYDLVDLDLDPLSGNL
jgi:hypothetical protein